MGAQQAIDKVNRIIRETQAKSGARSTRIPTAGRSYAAQREHNLMLELDARAQRILRRKQAEEAEIERAAALAHTDSAARVRSTASADTAR